MATLTVLWSPDPDALLARAASAFAVAGRVTEPLPLLAVRQGGVRDAVHELAGTAGCHGWLGTPVVVFSELAALLAGDLAPLTAFERRAIVTRLLHDHDLPLLARAARSARGRRAIESLLGDLIASDTTADELPGALAHGDRDDWMRQRDDELAALHAAYRRAIAALPPVGGIPRCDGSDALVQAARAVRARPDDVRRRLRRPFDPSVRRSINIYGLADLRHGWETLIHALHDADFIEDLRIYVSATADPATGGAQDFRARLAARADHVERVAPTGRSAGLAHLRDALFQPPGAVAPAAADVCGLAAPDMQRELEIVVRRVKRLITDDGVAPRSIAIVARQARPYANRAVELLVQAGVPATARLRHTLSNVPVLRMLLRIFAAAGRGWSPSALAQLGASPYLTLEMDTALLTTTRGAGRVRSIADWETMLAATARAIAENTDPDAELPDADRVERLRAQMTAFAVAARPVEGSRTLREWIALTLAAVGCAPADAPAPPGWDDGWLGLPVNAAAPASAVAADAATALADAAQLDLAALRGLTALLGDWRASLALMPAATVSAHLPPTEWARELESVLDETVVGVRTTQREGVQVLEALAAAGRAFDHVFLVGMTSGDFPTEPLRSPFFSDAECAALGARGLPLESASAWFDREASLFQLLARAARRSLTLSYSYADGSGTPQLASAYYDDVASRFAVGESGSWEARPGGSERVAGTLDQVSSASELALYAAHAWRDDPDAELATVRSALAALRDGAGDRQLVPRVLHAARIEQRREQYREQAREALRSTAATDRSALAHPWNGQIADADTLALLERHVRDRVWSATALETYGRCGFSYLGQRLLHADERPDDDADETAAERGTLVHAILADVYRSLALTLGGAALHGANVAQVQELVITATARAVEHEAVPRTLNDGLRAARERQIAAQVQQYVEWEMDRSARRKPAPRRPIEVELGFGNPGDPRPAVELRAADRSFRLRGRIDRVDVVTDPGAAGYLYVVDHKTGGGALSPLGALRDGGAILQLQLYMAAIPQLLGDTPIFGGAYQIVPELKAAGALERASFVRTGLKVEETETQRTAAEWIQRAPGVALGLISGIAEGRFAARTPAATRCLAYCSLRHACREERMGYQP